MESNNRYRYDIFWQGFIGDTIRRFQENMESMHLWIILEKNITQGTKWKKLERSY